MSVIICRFAPGSSIAIIPALMPRTPNISGVTGVTIEAKAAQIRPVVMVIRGVEIDAYQ